MLFYIVLKVAHNAHLLTFAPKSRKINNYIKSAGYYLHNGISYSGYCPPGTDLVSGSSTNCEEVPRAVILAHEFFSDDFGNTEIDNFFSV